ncbi:hypothetical protein F9Y90_05120 (plasmid) [Borrelia miyamotoi]|uniref:Uncharacterized protein n=1 Tax=Borrelia miyamotoi TaxID=47466 RepID=A0A5P8AUZ8_9SPIR|nr:hypothetical protein [Borrelia miyamotoi]QFP42486.1 hypothetical protein F9Y90_05120 [Borrelia miyamotoi]WAZ72266.1 hypothetical protein O5404_04350 [Borrelia miyamotoi]WVI05258.1 hypothetical protein F9Y91_00050 [Borrelia miyamotoi]
MILKPDRFWTTYMSDEVQSKKTDVNFPIINPEDIDYEYIYSYLKEWVSKKYTDNFEIKIKQIDTDEYLCETI